MIGLPLDDYGVCVLGDENYADHECRAIHPFTTPDPFTEEPTA